MKKLILLLLTVLTIQNVSYAAFPVTENNNSISIASELPIEDGDKAAKTSMILAGIAIFFNIILLTSSGLGWGALFLIFLAAMFYSFAFIFGLFGLRSKSKRWQAYIGLVPGLLVFFFLLISTGSFGDPDL